MSHGHVPPPQGHGRPRPRTEAPSRGKVCPELLQLQEWDAWALLSTLPGAAIPAARAQLAHEEPHKWLQQITKEYPDAVAQYLERKRLSNGDAAVNRGLQALENGQVMLASELAQQAAQAYTAASADTPDGLKLLWLRIRARLRMLPRARPAAATARPPRRGLLRSWTVRRRRRRVR